MKAALDSAPLLHFFFFSFANLTDQGRTKLPILRVCFGAFRKWKILHPETELDP